MRHDRVRVRVGLAECAESRVEAVVRVSINDAKEPVVVAVALEFIQTEVDDALGVGVRFAGDDDVGGREALVVAEVVEVRRLRFLPLAHDEDALVRLALPGPGCAICLLYARLAETSRDPPMLGTGSSYGCILHNEATIVKRTHCNASLAPNFYRNASLLPVVASEKDRSSR